MRALIQRVDSATVTVEGNIVGSIGQGLCALVGVTHEDTLTTAEKLASKIWGLRCFADEDGAMNLSASDLALPILVISQFTLYGDTTKGRRPSWIRAAPPETAEPLVEAVIDSLRRVGARVEAGRFRSHMKVSLVNDGPVTLAVEV